MRWVGGDAGATSARRQRLLRVQSGCYFGKEVGAGSLLGLAFGDGDFPVMHFLGCQGPWSLGINRLMIVLARTRTGRSVRQQILLFICETKQSESFLIFS
ncbi:hypothetical protein F01_480127 [Burkholderia cenocepacia]|nr:hypothetical protein F01_480127 [Burkholderia cenocepacia]